ncbi:hypothetical protein K0M31_010290 [Melipona bicolor]|uniref:Cadherin domain-containing protein n=1 Tax=Melipona bicolor TaxID=60889 RepID=A0AA40FLX5_9HYME|nr:hypothetical protein K0M31_010290 [Melipona bicolor]
MFKRKTTENTNGFSVVSGANNVNEPPILEPGGYPAGLPLSESTKVGTEVFVLKGHDPEGSPVKYGIQLTDHFVVNPRTGVITLAKPLNREELSSGKPDCDQIGTCVRPSDTVQRGKRSRISDLMLIAVTHIQELARARAVRGKTFVPGPVFGLNQCRLVAERTNDLETRQNGLILRNT